MPMTDVLDVLGSVFTIRGYEVREGPQGGLVATSPHETLLVDWKTDGNATREDVDILSRAIPAAEATRAVLVAPAGPARGVAAHATAHRVEVWDRARTAVEVGLAVLEGAPFPTPAAPPTPAPAARTPVPIAVPAAAPARAAHADGVERNGAVFLPGGKPTRSTDYSDPNPLPSPWDIAAGAARVPRQDFHRGPRQVRGEIMIAEEDEDQDVELTTIRSAVAARPAEPEAPSAPHGPATIPSADDVHDGGVLRAAVDARTAGMKVPGIGSVTGTELRLVPHFVFDYDCSVEDTRLPMTHRAKGTVLVSAVDGRIREQGILEFVDAPDGASRVGTRLAPVDVFDRVKGHVTRANTKVAKVEKEVGDVHVVNTERVVPDLEQLGLVHRGFVHVPMWRVTGTEGIGWVDGLTGEVVEGLN